MVLRVTGDLSHAAFQIIAARVVNGEVVGHSTATAFLWKRDGDYFLITNLHVITGWDYIRQRALNDLGWLPNRVGFPIGTRQKVDEHFERTVFSIETELFEPNQQPRWLVHPQHREFVDVAVLPLRPERLSTPNIFDHSLSTVAVNTVNFLKFDLDAGDDAYVLGFPRGLHGGAGFPLWKRASIASEPAFDLDGLPKLLIDTATRPGMSGSPAIVIRRGLIKSADGAEHLGQAPQFLGIYSGRVDDDPLGAQIGIVWKARVIDEIIDAQVVGSAPP